MKKERNILFIGHANPEDNEFTLWIRQKLINEGYAVECDLTFLIGGESDYWQNIQDCLEYSTAKYLLVLSHSSFQKNGVKDEWEFVRGLQNKYRIHDFIIPLKIDDVPYDTRIGLNRINIIDFSKSWATGFKRTLKKLRSDGPPIANIPSRLSIEEWIKNKYSTFEGILLKQELYYSNWLEILNLPAIIFVFEYEDYDQASFVSSSLEYPNIQHDKYIITFETELFPKFSENSPLFGKSEILINYVHKREIYIENILSNMETNEFPSVVDSRNFLIRLLKDSFHRFLKQKKLEDYTYSGSKLKCYYYGKEVRGTISNLSDEGFNFKQTLDGVESDNLAELSSKIEYIFQGKKKKKQLIGKYFDSIWHLGVTVTVKLFPKIIYEFKLHLLFSDDGINIWNNKERLHKARRDKGKHFFNSEQRDFLFAFLSTLQDDNGKIEVEVSKGSFFEVSSEPICFVHKYGYNEPKDKARLLPINALIDEELDDEQADDEYST